jgi:dolichol-phosphate mannosyltransferase
MSSWSRAAPGLNALRHPRALLDATPRPLRFCMVGASGVVVNAAALFLMHGPLRLPLTVAAVIATEVAIISNYTANNVITFPGRRWSLRRLARFNVASLVAAAIAVGILTVLVSTAHIHYLVADVIAIAIAATFNYVTSAWIVWTHRPVPLTPAGTQVQRAS